MGHLLGRGHFLDSWNEDIKSDFHIIYQTQRRAFHVMYQTRGTVFHHHPYTTKWVKKRGAVEFF